MSEFKIERIQKIDSLSELMTSSFNNNITDTRTARVFVTQGIEGCWDLLVLMKMQNSTCISQVLSIKLSAEDSEFTLMENFPQRNKIFNYLSEINFWEMIGDE